jgi:hypothetical protein
MEVTIQYHKAQVEEAIRYLALNNKSFLGENDYIRQSIYRSFHELVYDFLSINYRKVISNCGYVIIATVHSKEGIDYDENVLSLQVYVDPSMMADHDEAVSETYDAPIF